MRGIFDKVAWSSWLRLPLFWLVVAATVALVAHLAPILSFTTLGEGWNGLLKGDSAPARTEAFAYALAVLIAAVAAGVASAVFILHVGCIVFSLWRVRRIIDGRPDKRAFAVDFDTVYDQIKDHPLVGHAFTEFSATLERPVGGDIVKSTIRPQNFLTMAMLRERLTGLKYLTSVPGYFVGIGLFFTFIGLVFALGEASKAVGANDSTAMTGAVGKLLTAATFKFSTSIAGLGASIALSIWFKSATISIEAALSRLCMVLEKRLAFLSQQNIQMQMNRELGEQTAQLKTLASDQFITRFGESVGSKMAEATAISLAPVTERIDAAIDALRAKTSDGIAELVKSFSDSLQDGAGVEMKAVSATLKQMAETLTTLQSRLDGSGEAFANRITVVTTELARTAAETGRAAAAAQIEATKGFSEASAAWKDSAQAAGRQFERDAATAGAKVSAEVEKVMGAGFATLHGEVERMNSGLAVLREAFAANADGLRASANHSQDAARAFGAAAENLRTSTGPLAQSTRTIAEAVQRIDTAMSASVVSLSESNAAARGLADELRTHQTALAESWRDYSARFEKVDDDLGRAFEALGKATADQIAKIISFVSEIDKSLEKTLQQLNAPLTELGSATGELSDNVEKLLKASKNPG